MKLLFAIFSLGYAGRQGNVHEMSANAHLDEKFARVPSVPTADKILSLPGLAKMPDFDMYSGYLDVSATKKLHYWFVQSQNDPATDPVVVWMNGGPGCSSMEGFFAEHGPLHLNDDETISMNPHAWNMNANMIYLEAPIGVGFSYGSTEDMKVINDNTTSSDNRDALKNFFTKFPNYLANGLYISGESYAGIYVPTLIAKIVDDPMLSPAYKGAIIGNGLYSWQKNQQSIVFFAKYHGLIDTRNWAQLLENCCTGGNAEKCDFFNYPSDACENLVNKVVGLTWSGGLDVYNLYSECAGGISSKNFMNHMTKKLGFSQILTPMFDGPPCTDSNAMESYLNTKKVKDAIHVRDDIKWVLCADDLNYVTVVDDVSEYILHALNQVSDSRVLLYAGDVDMACNFLGGEMFAEALKLPLLEDYSEWTYIAEDTTKQVGGWYKKFDRLSWLTIKGAGHMVPTDTPIQAYNMFQAFLDGKL